jgi:hypothetical protein
MVWTHSFVSSGAYTLRIYESPLKKWSPPREIIVVLVEARQRYRCLPNNRGQWWLESAAGATECRATTPVAGVGQ